MTLPLAETDTVLHLSRNPAGMHVEIRLTLTTQLSANEIDVLNDARANRRRVAIYLEDASAPVEIPAAAITNVVVTP